MVNKTISINVKKETLSKLHDYCYPGETHDMFVNRLLNGIELHQIRITEDTWKRACALVSNSDPDEVLNVLMDKCSNMKKKRK